MVGAMGCRVVVVVCFFTTMVHTKKQGKDEFENGKLSSGQVFNDHKYHHILVEPKQEKPKTAELTAHRSGGDRRFQDDEDLTSDQYRWFTSSRGGCVCGVRGPVIQRWVCMWCMWSSDPEMGVFRITTQYQSCSTRAAVPQLQYHTVPQLQYHTVPQLQYHIVPQLQYHIVTDVRCPPYLLHYHSLSSRGACPLPPPPWRRGRTGVWKVLPHQEQEEGVTLSNDHKNLVAS
ncbi:hypothetical protein FHG87_020852 [Trinorchestia longiramus]|nr:hypothetical protein FHG87_020852 [Trinorchestia longiramus]